MYINKPRIKKKPNNPTNISLSLILQMARAKLEKPH